MLRNRLIILVVFVILGSSVFTGCSKNIESPSSVTNNTAADTGNTETTETSADITIVDPYFNHGYSISVASTDRPYEIKRSDDVLSNQDQALEYLLNCVELPGQDFKFVLNDTSDNDPGAYMWYEFTLFYKDIEVRNADFTVITFTDGTICEGRTEILTCSFADSDDVISSSEALNIYTEKYQDDRDYKFIESCYFFTGKGNETCAFTYIFRYDCGKFGENETMVLNAKTGERLGCWPDAIID